MSTPDRTDRASILIVGLIAPLVIVLACAAIIERWLQRTALQAHYTRRQRMLGEVAHLDEVLAACGDADVVVLAADAIPAPGWLQQLAACLARDASIATATPWSNAGETASWPRIGEISAVPDDPHRLARACAQMPPLHPELPAAVGHAVALRGSARRRAGGLFLFIRSRWVLLGATAFPRKRAPSISCRPRARIRAPRRTARPASGAPPTCGHRRSG